MKTISVRSSVRLAVAAGEPDAWWHYLDTESQYAHVAAVTTFSEREAREMSFMVRDSLRRRHQATSLAAQA